MLERKTAAALVSLLCAALFSPSCAQNKEFPPRPDETPIIVRDDSITLDSAFWDFDSDFTQPDDKTLRRASPTERIRVIKVTGKGAKVRSVDCTNAVACDIEVVFTGKELIRMKNHDQGGTGATISTSVPFTFEDWDMTPHKRSHPAKGGGPQNPRIVNARVVIRTTADPNPQPVVLCAANDCQISINYQ